MTRWWTVAAAAVVAATLTGCGAVYVGTGATPGAGPSAASGPAPAPVSVSATGMGSATGTAVSTSTVPPVSSSTAGSEQPAPRTVTLANEGQTITMNVGQTFTLELGDPPPDWTVTVTDPSILARLPNVAMMRGAQGIYKAKQAGTTTLTAISTYPCQQAHPACMIASRVFRVTVTVQPA